MRYLYIKDGSIKVLEETVYFNHCPCGERVMVSKAVHDLLDSGTVINCKKCKQELKPYRLKRGAGGLLDNGQKR